MRVYLQWIQPFSSELSLHSSILLHLSFRDLISSPLSQRNNSSEICFTSCVPRGVKTFFKKIITAFFLSCVLHSGDGSAAERVFYIDSDVN